MLSGVPLLTVLAFLATDAGLFLCGVNAFRPHKYGAALLVLLSPVSRFWEGGDQECLQVWREQDPNVRAIVSSGNYRSDHEKGLGTRVLHPCPQTVHLEDMARVPWSVICEIYGR
ncbi:MAG: hypothetical protein ACYCXT_09025 [Acidiferrobacteraceae bacterium]